MTGYIATLTYCCIVTAHGYTAYDCRHSHVQNVTDYFVLDASAAPVVNSQPFCRAVGSRYVSGQAYDVNVVLYSYDGDGHTGVTYNVLDEDNFDFVIFRWRMISFLTEAQHIIFVAMSFVQPGIA